MVHPRVVGRQCLLVLARSWPLVLATTLVLALLAGAMRVFLVPNSYEAEALVLVTRPRYQVELESRIKSTQEPLAGVFANAASLRLRLDTLATLARSPEVETGVRQRLANRPDLSELENTALPGRIRVRPTNEVLRISAVASDPAVAAALANLWADEVAARVETIYSAGAGIKAVEAEVQNAQERYTAADRALNRFSMEHPLDELTRRVQAKSEEVKLLEALQDHRLEYVRGRVLSIHTSILEIDQIVRDAETLRAQLSQSTRSQAALSGDGLALMMLRARAYLAPAPAPAAEPTPVKLSPAPVENRSSVTVNTPTGSTTILQLPPPTTTLGGDHPEDRVEDLVAMIQALRGRRDELQAEFDNLSQRLRTGQDPASALALPGDDPNEVALRQAQAELREAQFQLGELTRQREELVQQRKLLGTGFETLQNKAQELQVLRATDDGGGVTVAERAVAPRAPAGPGPLRYALIGAALGFLLGCALALAPTLFGGLRRFLGGQLRGTSASDEDRAPGVAVS